MSAATVRQAVRDYLAGGDLTGVQRVYKAPPWWVDGGTFKLSGGLAQGTGWGAVLIVNLDQQQETRITLPALTGQKGRHYKVGVLAIMQWLLRSAAAANAGEDGWVDASDTLLDGIVALIEADPNLGNPAVIFQAGQGPDNIRISRDIPKLDREGGLIHIWHLVEFDLTEIVTA